MPMIPMIHRDIFSHGSIWKRARFMDVDHARSIDVPNSEILRPPEGGGSRPELIIQPRSIMPCTDTRRSRLAKCLYFVAVDGLLPALKRQDRRPGGYRRFLISLKRRPRRELLFPSRVSRESRKSRSFFEYFIIGVLVCSEQFVSDCCCLKLPVWRGMEGIDDLIIDEFSLRFLVTVFFFFFNLSVSVRMK